MGYRVYYMGDPGLFGGIGKLLGKIAKPVLRAVPGVGIAMSAADIAGSVFKKPIAGIAAKIGGKFLKGSVATPGIAGGIAGAVTKYDPMFATQQIARGIRGGGMLGKVALGAAGAAAGYGAARAVDEFGNPIRRRYRRMNVANPRALKRSMRRVKAFSKMARECITFTQRHRMKKGCRTRKG